jgi:flavin reductase (DIM6/NTAB) family NADH-FMN oxidoreductase RutF
VRGLRALPLAEVYRHLEPGPVVLVSTWHEDRADLMAMSWHAMMEFEPPLVGCVISARNATFRRLLATRECVIAVPTAEIAPQVVACGNTSGRTVDKFSRFGLTPLAAARVKAPLVGECYANFECRLHDARLASKYNFLVLRVVKAWIDPARAKRPRTLHHRGRGVFMVAGRELRLRSGKK